MLWGAADLDVVHPGDELRVVGLGRGLEGDGLKGAQPELIRAMWCSRSASHHNPR